MCFFQSGPVARDPETRSLPVGMATTTELKLKLNVFFKILVKEFLLPIMILLI